MYILVEFTDEKNVAVIPENWLEGTSCAVWPDNIKAPGRINNAVKEKVHPGESWPAYPIRELYRNESFVEVRKRLRKTEELSDLKTTDDSSEEEDITRKSKRKKRAPVFSDDENDDWTAQPTCSQSHRQSQNLRADSPEEDEQLRRLPVKPPAPIPPRGNFGQKCPQVGKRPTSVSVDLSTGEIIRQASQNSVIARDEKMFTCLEKIIQGQQEIKTMLGQLTSAISNISAGNGQSVTQEWTQPDDMDLPVRSPEMMDRVESQLEEKDVFNGLVNYLTVLGGKTVTAGTRRALATVLSNDMATKYNWYGLKGKLAFSKLKLCTAVQRAVMKSCKCYVSDFEKECREWLRTASDRDGGRKKRKIQTVTTNDDRF